MVTLVVVSRSVVSTNHSANKAKRKQTLASCLYDTVSCYKVNFSASIFPVHLDKY